MLRKLLSLLTTSSSPQINDVPLGGNPDALLRAATAKKDEGQIDTAIQLLRQAYQLIALSSIQYPVETFLRLPLYLQRAGKADEAWAELNKLLTNGYPNQPASQQLLPMDHYVIYDKMRLFLQREGNPD